MAGKRTDTIASRNVSVHSPRRMAEIAELDEVFSSLARMLKRSVRCSWTVVYLLKQDGHGFAPPLAFTLPLRLTTALQTMPLLPGKESDLHRLLSRRRELLLPDPGSAGLLAPQLQKILAPYSLLAVPLRVRQQLQGLVLLGRPHRHEPFTPAELALVREQVSQAALIAGHLRLSNESLDMSIDIAKRVEAAAELARCAGSQFDPAIVDCFRSRLARLVKNPAIAV